MSKTHTPGPWMREVKGDGYQISASPDGRWTKVATVHGMFPHDSHLIAAAPDLLAALKEAANELWRIPIASARVLRLAKLAIHKAENRS